MRDLKARERKGVAVGKDKYIFLCARFAATVTLRARSHALEENNSLQKITVCNEYNSKFDKKKVISVAIFELLIQCTFKDVRAHF